MIQNKTTVALIIPTYNAAQYIPDLFPAIMQQTLQPDHILVIDSSSTDNTRTLLADYPVNVHTIPQREFDHGGTRKLGNQLVNADIYLYLTQDAIPANPNAFAALVAAITQSDTIACAYGRQLPKTDATPLSAHGRIFNYPEQSYVRHYADRNHYGIKTCFNSDSFAAYKKTPLEEVGNFPVNLISTEDVYVAAKLLQKGYGIAYAADAIVFHSHNLSLKEEFHRYFSIGVFHGRENWILNDFSSATGEGFRFVKSEWAYLIQQKQLRYLPLAFISTFVKYAAYKLGLYEKHLPLSVKKRWGVNKSFWLIPTT